MVDGRSTSTSEEFGGRGIGNRAIHSSCHNRGVGSDQREEEKKITVPGERKAIQLGKNYLVHLLQWLEGGVKV